MRKVTVKVEVTLQIDADEGVEITEVLENMDYSFTSQTEGADIQNTEIRDWEITDSK